MRWLGHLLLIYATGTHLSHTASCARRRHWRLAANSRRSICSAGTWYAQSDRSRRSVRQIGAVAAVYPGVWGIAQLATGWLSDLAGRKPLIAVGMLVQAGALGLLVAGNGTFSFALAAAVLLGLGTALVYPTLIAAVSDAVAPRGRAKAIGVYRFWRDTGFVLGALGAGFGADVFGSGPTIWAVAGLTAASGFAVAATRFHIGAGDARHRQLPLGRYGPAS